MAEQLIAAADGQERRPRLEGFVERGPECGELGRDQRLLTILTTAHVEQVVFSPLDLGACAEWPHLELIAPPGGPGAQDGDVAAVGVDVEVIREKVADDKRFHDPERYRQRLITRKGEPQGPHPGGGCPTSDPQIRSAQFDLRGAEASCSCGNADPLRRVRGRMAMLRNGGPRGQSRSSAL